MPGMDGMTVLRELRRRDSAVPILLLTAYATVPTAVEALQIGASDYLRKPFDVETVLATINRHIADASDVQTVNEQTTNDMSLSASLPVELFIEFIGATPALQPALARAGAAQTTPLPVIVRGEMGAGRRHLARLIHALSETTAGKKLVEIDCANLPPAVIAHELLAEPSADQSGGLWQQALGGTLLLSNLESLPEELAQQAAELLAPYLLSNERPHGLRLLLTSTSTLSAAWTQILALAFDISLPPLRARIDDLPLLLAHFAPNAEWDRQVFSRLSSYDWPGNVAELQRVVQQATYLAAGEQVKSTHLPSHFLDTDSRVAGVFVLPPEGIKLDTVEEMLIRQALEMADGNKTQAARLLGLSRATLLYRIDKYEILAVASGIIGSELIESELIESENVAEE
jgi:two-component system response regulator AtoC